ncbi:unnamed protein product [Mesocestoides corti]|nr:unnamed protein product [Mesocestoides corti]
MVTSEALKKMETSEGEGPQLDDLPIIASLLSVNLNPFSATRLISLLEVIGSEERGRSDSALTTVFDVIEGLLKGIMSDRDISDTTVYCEGPQNWPLLQGFLRVNLLPFSLARNIQLLIELLSTLSACCNSIVTSTKLPTVMRVAEALVGSFLGKPDFLTLQVTNLSSLADWCLLVRRKSGEGDIADSTGGPKDSPCVPQRCSEGPVFSSVASHRRRPFMEALYKAVELTAPETLDWTHEIVHLDAASRILPSDIRDRIRELEYDLSLRDALFPLPEVPGHLQYLLPDAWANLGELKSILSEVETLIGAAAFQIYSTTGSKPVADAETIETFSDRDFSLELAALARFYASFKKWTIDAEKRTRNYAKASSCKVPSPSSAHRRNGHPRHQRACESASRSSRNGHDKHDSDRKRQNSRHLNTVGIMDNILAGLDSEPLYADIHKVLAKTQQNES